MQLSPPGAPLDAVIGMGSNLGDRMAHLAAALGGLRRLGRVTMVSSLYETEPVGPPQPKFLNAAARLETKLEPMKLLAALLELEQERGRIRRERWGPRTLDLDLLWFQGKIVDEPALKVPHPGLKDRAFALLPLLDVAASAIDPRTGRTYADVLESLSDGSAGVCRVSDATWPPPLL